MPGFLSIAGGKLASYRLMAEETVDLVCRKLGKGEPCRTHLVPLPGGDRKVNPEDLSRQFEISIFAAQRLVYRYGSRAYAVLELTRGRTTARNAICACDPVLECELRFAVRNEWARTLDDLRRRTRFSVGPCQGTRCFLLGAQILGEEMDLSPREVLRQTGEILQQRWAEKAPILDGTSVQQEELCSSIYYNVGCLDL